MCDMGASAFEMFIQRDPLIPGDITLILNDWLVTSIIRNVFKK